MASRSRAMAREELLKIIQLCESIEKSGVDPFTVDVKSLLNRLRHILDSQKTFDTILVDAETLYKIAIVIALQHKWLRDRAASLFVDSQLVAVRILSADLRDIASWLASSWRPIVFSEQLTAGMVRDGLEYFLGLPTRAGPREGTSSASDISGSIQDLLPIFSQDKPLEDEVRNIHGEMLELAGDGGRLDYFNFISREGEMNRPYRAYLVSFIVSEGLAEILRNPLTGEIYLQPFREKLDRKTVTSLPITVTVKRDGRDNT
ncbi:hypothetical protein HRbin01_00551 [archaeon HR01]|nr:hypothetical protein HRbin01_00551 [archaeon HR01]